MLDVLGNTTYRRLFAAQLIALVGTGLATVALALLAYDLSPGDAGRVLGTALFLKMLVYVIASPFAGVLASRFSRKSLLVGLDIVRAIVAVGLPFVTEIWQVYLLIVILQSASAVFTPTFQATIPDILTDEQSYTKALSLSRLAYDMENLLSPALAAILLVFVDFHALFLGTAAGFLLSMCLVVSTLLPAISGKDGQRFRKKLTRGAEIYMATPRLRALLALNVSVAAAGSMVIVNTVVLVRQVLGSDESLVAVAMAVFGAGSMAAALALPRILQRLDDRTVMLGGATGLGLVMALFSALTVIVGPSVLWPGLLLVWFLLGLSWSAVQTPSGRLLRRSSHGDDRPALFAAQFALSHACWLFAYPLAGWVGGAAGMTAVAAILACLAIAGAVVGALAWPRDDTEDILHAHPDLPPDHPHLRDTRRSDGTHVHAYVIDELHPTWPRGGI